MSEPKQVNLKEVTDLELTRLQAGQYQDIIGLQDRMVQLRSNLLAINSEIDARFSVYEDTKE